MTQDSYPSRLRLFKAWAKAMEAGATVGKPDYKRVKAGPGRTSSRRRGRRRRRKSHKGKKED